MKTKNIVKLFTIGFVFSSLSGLSAKNAFEGEWGSSDFSEIGIKASIDENLISAHTPESVNSANYKINGDTLHYTAVPNDPKQVPQKGTCKIVKLNDHLFFQEQLQCTGSLGKLLDSDQKIEGTSKSFKGKVFRSPVPAGKERKIQGKEVITVLKTGKINDAAYLRSAPDASAKPLTCTLSKPDSNGHASKGYEGQVIPKDTELSVIARTKTKVKVQKWENYWYYVEKRSHNLVADWITSCGPGWVYGEFITLK